MSIWLQWVFMPHYIGPSLRSFCLLKVAHLFDCVSLTVLLGLLGDLGSALSVISLSIRFSLLSLLPSSQLGHIVQLALRDLPLLSLISSHILFPPFADWFACLFPFSPIFLDSPFSLFLSLLSPSSPLHWSQLGHIVQLALRPSVPFCSLSPSLPFASFLPPCPFFPCLSLPVPSSLSSTFLRPSGVQLVAYCSARSILLLSLPLSSPLDPPGHIVRFILRVSSSPISSPLQPPLLPSLPSSSSPRSQPGHIVRLAASLHSCSPISSLLPPSPPPLPVSFSSR